MGRKANIAMKGPHCGNRCDFPQFIKHPGAAYVAGVQDTIDAAGRTRLWVSEIRPILTELSGTMAGSCAQERNGYRQQGKQSSSIVGRMACLAEDQCPHR